MKSRSDKTTSFAACWLSTQRKGGCDALFDSSGDQRPTGNLETSRGHTDVADVPRDYYLRPSLEPRIKSFTPPSQPGAGTFGDASMTFPAATRVLGQLSLLLGIEPSEPLDWRVHLFPTNTTAEYARYELKNTTIRAGPYTQTTAPSRFTPTDTRGTSVIRWGATRRVPSDADRPTRREAALAARAD